MFKQIGDYVQKEFDTNTLKGIEGFIRIPNVSPDYDSKWETNGLCEKAANFLCDYGKALNIKGVHFEIIKDPGYTPFIFVEIEPSSPDIKKTIALYAHLDKMPPLDEKLWTEGRLPYEPKIIKDYLYGRGAADDGYASFSILSTIKTIQDLKLPHGKIFCLFEMDEESSGDHILYYVKKLYEKIKGIDMLICSDCGCADYERFWLTASLRGIVCLNLKVEMLKEGIHSGDGGGVVPDTFRIMRILLNRIENQATGKMAEELDPPIPPESLKEAEESYKLIMEKKLPTIKFVENGKHQAANEKNPLLEAYLNRSWRSCMTITGCEGLPSIEKAGNVLRPDTTLKVSIRIPPHLNMDKAKEFVIKSFTENPPYNAKITISGFDLGEGVYLKPLSKELNKIIDDSSNAFFGKNALMLHDGGSIPFLAHFMKLFPKAEIIGTGAAGNNSNEHSPNEALNLTYTKQYLAALVYVISEYSKLN